MRQAGAAESPGGGRNRAQLNAAGSNTHRFFLHRITPHTPRKTRSAYAHLRAAENPNRADDAARVVGALPAP